MHSQIIWTATCLLCISVWRPEAGRLAVQSYPTEKNMSLHQVELYRKVSYDFDKDLCNWTSLDSRAYPLTWNWSSGGYAYIDMDFERRHDKGRLVSPWLSPRPDYVCQLHFSYAFLRSNKCALSVVRQTADNEEAIWTTMRSASLAQRQNVGMDCETERFRIVFEGERRYGSFQRGCGTFLDNIIKLDRIEITGSPRDRHPSGRLDPWLLAGITVTGIVVLLAAVCVVVIVFRRCGAEGGRSGRCLFITIHGKSKSSSVSTRVSRAKVNSSYDSDDEQTPVLGGHTGGNSDSVHVYSTADDNDCTLTAQAQNPTHARPTSHKIDRHQDRYNQLNLKGTKVLPSYAPASANDEYDHTEVRHGRKTLAPAQTERSISRQQQQQQQGTTDYENIGADGGVPVLFPSIDDVYN